MFDEAVSLLIEMSGPSGSIGITGFSMPVERMKKNKYTEHSMKTN